MNKNQYKIYVDFKEVFSDLSELLQLRKKLNQMYSNPEYALKAKRVISSLEYTKEHGKSRFAKILKKYDLLPIDIDFVYSMLFHKYEPECELVLYDAYTHPLNHVYFMTDNNLRKAGYLSSKHGGFELSNKAKYELFEIPNKSLKNNSERSEYELERIRMIEQENMLYNRKLKKEEEEKKVKYSIKPVKDFNDIILNDRVKAKLQSALTMVSKKKMLSRRFGLDKIHKNQSVILNFHGPSGTGKTLAAEVFAKNLGKNYLIVNYSQLISKWSGDTEKNLDEMFKIAKKEDAILFFDEVDSLVSNRESAKQGWELLQVNSFMMELEKFTGVCIMATNMINKLDPAIERRVMMHIGFENPSVNEREQIFKVLLRHSAYDKNIDFKTIVKKYAFSGGLIKNAIVNAIAIAASKDAKKLTEEHLIKGCEQVFEGSMAIYGKEEKVTYWG